MKKHDIQSLVCDRCGNRIPAGEDRKLYGQILCEECFMDLLSPLKGCDPWAVYSAKSFAKSRPQGPELTALQHRILNTIRERGSIEPKDLAGILNLKESDLERELAVLRHMEKVRGALSDGKHVTRLWDSQNRGI